MPRVHRARILTVLLLAAVAAALLPSGAQAARTPQLQELFVKDAQYCVALGMRPRVQVQLSAPGKVTFTVWSIDPLDPLKLPKQTAGPKTTTTLPQGVSVLDFPVALGKTLRDFKPGYLNVLLGVPAAGWQVGTPKLDALGFTRLPYCG